MAITAKDVQKIRYEEKMGRWHIVARIKGCKLWQGFAAIRKLKNGPVQVRRFSGDENFNDWKEVSQVEFRGVGASVIKRFTA